MWKSPILAWKQGGVLPPMIPMNPYLEQNVWKKWVTFWKLSPTFTISRLEMVPRSALKSQCWQYVENNLTLNTHKWILHSQSFFSNSKGYLRLSRPFPPLDLYVTDHRHKSKIGKLSTNLLLFIIWSQKFEFHHNKHQLLTWVGYYCPPIAKTLAASFTKLSTRRDILKRRQGHDEHAYTYNKHLRSTFLLDLVNLPVDMLAVVHELDLSTTNT